MSWQTGEPEAAPKVYLPQGDGEAPPAYDAYADPAEAHGWQKGYEEGDGVLREAHEDGGAVAPEAPDAPEAPVAPEASDAYEAHEASATYDTHEMYTDGYETVEQAAVLDDPSSRRDRLQRRRRARMLRRTAVGAGAVCVAVLAVVISGLFDSGSSADPGSSGGGHGGARGEASATPSAGATDGSAASEGTPGESPGASSASASPHDTSSATAKATESPSASTSTTPASTTPTTPAATSTSDSGRGNPGHGQGSSKKPN